MEQVVSVTKSEAISEDMKVNMAAYQSLDDLTVLPTKYNYGPIKMQTRS